MLVRACDEFCAITRGGDKGADFNLASLCLFSFELKRAAASIVGERTRHTIAIVAAAAHFLFMPPRRTELFGSCCCYYWEREPQITSGSSARSLNGRKSCAPRIKIASLSTGGGRVCALRAATTPA